MLVDAYEHRSVDELGAVLTNDYRYHFPEEDLSGAGWLEGFTRDVELEKAAGVFRRFSKIRTSVDRFESGPDPEHADSLSHYRVVIAHRMKLHAVIVHDGRDEIIENLPGQHVFYLVRGNAALLAPGQVRHPGRWYIRAWFEDVEMPAKQLATVEGQCESAAAELTSPTSSALAIHAINHPLCATVMVMCDLPSAEAATLEVFDLAGRRVAQRMLQPTAAGTTMRVEAGSGMRFAPGAYFVRLSQGRAKPVNKMVLVAK
ncbi:MAG: hypothetical protein HZA61_16370 [Candidatus Eisenbacteria bacterium]|uniref:T9SS type A sorting domain-containing protein n=1 Tax=Eiseniibacteriota bacterium TaxID=2212470 RepID=A0A933SEF8_UNCEI|nr:hypothetical protein [Candidatus Eisenbacteria bacterium]